ncbi:hypothetical protein [Bacillus norwichensis]|uniref:Phage portal protein n=1 Tax=Bacillus norwichensis TaxID=2762217 RepID=A0ABR8VM44_9BACI|nr:hypothetical protein [Bacillus norwichensis]MBD8005848.1 hypothetical protein [Bacillus norwichensis]
MIKEAIKFVTNLGIKPAERKLNFMDQDGNLRNIIISDDGRPVEIASLNYLAKEALVINTLTGLVDYIQSNVERHDIPYFLHIVDHERVELTGVLQSDGKRETLVIARAIVPDFNYDYFLDSEQLIISLQSKFTKTKDRDLLLKVIGNVKEENVRQTGDNGIAQAVTIKTGVASADDVLVPNPVTLAPYRTFLEVVQPESDFIFRMKDGPRGAIFEADGGAWRNQAIENIRAYLSEELADEINDERITIIA